MNGIIATATQVLNHLNALNQATDTVNGQKMVR